MGLLSITFFTLLVGAYLTIYRGLYCDPNLALTAYTLRLDNCYLKQNISTTVGSYNVGCALNPNYLPVPPLTKWVTFA
jgi:hypothetical protein